jgi:hypothetical protein
MCVRDQFLLLVTGYLIASCGNHAQSAWSRIKRARQIPDSFWLAISEGSVEHLAFEFALFSCGEGPRPQWLPLTEEEERFRDATKPKRQPR